MANYRHQMQSCLKWASGVQPAESWRGYTAGLVSLRRNQLMLLFCILNQWFAQFKACWKFKLCFVTLKGKPIIVHSQISSICDNKCRIFFSLLKFTFSPLRASTSVGDFLLLPEWLWRQMWTCCSQEVIKSWWPAWLFLKLTSVLPIKSFFHQSF